MRVLSFREKYERAMDCKLALYVPNGVENIGIGRLHSKVDHPSRPIRHLTLHTNDDQIPSSNPTQTKSVSSMDVDTVRTKEVFARSLISRASAQVQFGVDVSLDLSFPIVVIVSSWSQSKTSVSNVTRNAPHDFVHVRGHQQSQRSNKKKVRPFLCW